MTSTGKLPVEGVEMNRIRFESWMRANTTADLSRDTQGNYKVYEADLAWRVWQHHDTAGDDRETLLKAMGRAGL